MSEAPHPVVTGVYFLFQKRKLVYIGRSDNVYKRLNAHRHNGRPYDYALVAATSSPESVWVEAALHAATRAANPPRETGALLPSREARLPQPREWETAPDVLSVQGGYDLLQRKGYPLSGAYRAAVKDGTIPSVQVGSVKRLLRVDVEAWAFAELEKLGFAIAKLKPPSQSREVG